MDAQSDKTFTPGNNSDNGAAAVFKKDNNSLLNNALGLSTAATAADSPMSTRPQTPALFQPSDTPKQPLTKDYPIDLNGFSWP
ncbi:hypothetical protein GGI12_005709, partial [Dipsacomyces acuminosporus]